MNRYDYGSEENSYEVRKCRDLIIFGCALQGVKYRVLSLRHEVGRARIGDVCSHLSRPLCADMKVGGYFSMLRKARWAYKNSEVLQAKFDKYLDQFANKAQILRIIKAEVKMLQKFTEENT